MNRVINGKRYDTEKAEKVASWSNGLYVNDFYYYDETLYRKRTGEFFLHLSGGAASAVAQSCDGGTIGGDVLRPLTYAEADEWAQDYLDADERESIFGEQQPEDDACPLRHSRTIDDCWDKLLKMGVSEETLQVVTDINGYSIDTLEDVLYATQGYREFDQLDEED